MTLPPMARRDGDLHVCLGPGTHSVGAGGLAFGPEDSSAGGRRVVWRGGVEEPSVVSGGVQVTGWRAVIASPPLKSTYAAEVPASAQQLPAVRQLWVHGTRANRTTIVAPGCTPTDGKLPPSCRLDRNSAWREETDRGFRGLT